MKSSLSILSLAALLASATLVGLCGCAGNRYEQSTGEQIDDKATSMRVKSALAHDSEYKFPQVEVQTFKGVTQLSGFVNSGDQKSRAVEIAKGVEGVKTVENNIAVK